MHLRVRLAIALLAASACGTDPTPAAPKPPARTEHAMVFDAAHQKFLVFGGSGGPGTVLGDLWAWDGIAWTQLSTTGPAPRMGAIMTYDPAGSRVLLYGGSNSTGTHFTDVWAWNGSAWSQLSASGGPPIQHAAGAWNPNNGRLVIHRGFSGTAPERDTWEWDGAQWVQVTSNVPTAFGVPLPSPMFYDAARSMVLMFIGDANNNQTALWEWTGAAWNDLGAGPSIATPNPIVRLGTNDLLMLETNPSSFGTMRTWRWNGSTWTALAITGPPKRFVGTMAAGLNQVVMFGGQALGGAGLLDDTWVWDGTSWTIRPVPME